MTRLRCPATLEYEHSDATCKLPVGHDGRHEGWCWTCVEWGEGDLLEWDLLRESWIKGGRHE